MGRKVTKWRLWALGLILPAAGLLTGGYLYVTGLGNSPRFATTRIERGLLTVTVSTTGRLNPVATVQVGTQVSGQIRELFADFNSQVKKDQLIARIDPQTFEAKVSQARADVDAGEATVLDRHAQVERARADVEGARAALAGARAQTARSEIALLDAKRDLERKMALSQRRLVSPAERDSAQATHDSARAQVEASRAQEEALASAIRAAQAQLRMAEAQQRAAEANVRQKRAGLQQAVLHLDHTFIRSPVDGVVLSRNVNVGQTVAVSLSAPTLFTIAQDLTEMQVDTNVDEADIGRIQVGQRATFTVDSFPEQILSGTVTQVRNAAKVLQNVVTYNVVVGVDNPGQKLLPGLTANVRIAVVTRPDALKVPNAALRFRRPGDDAPPGSSARLTSQEVPRPPSGTSVVAVELTKEQLARKLKLTDQQQERLEPILEERRRQLMRVERFPRQRRRAAALRVREEIREKIRAFLIPEQQALYDQLPVGQPTWVGPDGRLGTVWVLEQSDRLRPISVRLGMSDGSFTEVLDGDLQEGHEVVVSASTG